MWKTFLGCVVFLLCGVLESSLKMQMPGEEGTLYFDVEARRTDFSICVEEKSWVALPEKLRDQFKQGEKGYAFTYKQMVIPFDEPFLAKKRCFEQEHPQSINVQELADWIRKRKVIVYTGAGLSAAAGVPMMHELTALFPLDRKGIERAVKNPKHLTRKLRRFYRACYLSSPTRAHKSLKRVIDKTESALFTENLDQLHQRSGITPFCVTTSTVKEAISEKLLQETDAILCIGMSQDHKGLLGWYKQLHPKGKIISIDLQQPSYLGEEDFFLQGDVQKVLPHLAGVI